MIWAMILAAGQSKRMGTPKLLLPFGENTIIETIVGNVVRSKVNNVLVILGSDREKIEKKTKKFPVQIAYNPKYAEGMLSSVQKGIAAVPSNTRAVFIVLGDSPLISYTTIDKIFDEYHRTGKGIVLPVYQQRRGHPVLIDMKYRREIHNLSPDIGLRELIHNHPEDIHEVGVDTPGILQDIDDADDYNRELKNIRVNSRKSKNP